jgi:hypothetical protein
MFLIWEIKNMNFVDLARLSLWGARSDQVARWFVFEPHIQIWVNFGGPFNGKCWHFLWSFGVYYANLVMLW